jgi:two-component system chemotaxis response regulator CheB
MTPARDELCVVAIGASRGGAEAIGRLLGTLKTDLDAALFVSTHLAPHGPRHLARMLAPSTAWHVAEAEQGQKIERGRVYVAVPDHHLVIHRGHVALSRGPRENGHRPSVDVLFRSAAIAYGSRTIGVVLTGALDDGTAGLMTIKRHGGAALVQDPHEAKAPDMPRSAAEHVPVDAVLPIEELARAIEAQCEKRTHARVLLGVDDTARYEVAIAEMDPEVLLAPSTPGKPTRFTCPECTGVLSELEEEGVTHFRCQIGHAYGVEGLLEAQDHAVETALWTAMRALRERLVLLQRVGSLAGPGGTGAERHADRIVEIQRSIEVLRTLLLRAN